MQYDLLFITIIIATIFTSLTRIIAMIIISSNRVSNEKAKMIASMFKSKIFLQKPNS